jgi:vitamin B12 transporter
MKAAPSARIPANNGGFAFCSWSVQSLDRPYQRGGWHRAYLNVFIFSMKTIVMTLRLSALACAAACAVSGTAYAQTAPELKEVVITATRTETQADELVSEVVVVTRAQIEQSSGRTLPEVLSRTAGVQFFSYGGLGKAASIYIRGAEARHTLLLIDGARIGSATAGAPSWENIPLDMIERIEILKGPASALYGSDGVGGVVQIFTRSGVKGFSPLASVTLGSLGHTQLSAGVRGGSAEVSYALGAQRTRERGFSATNSQASFGNFNPDDDGFKQDALNASLRWKFAPDWSLDAKLLHSGGETQFDDGAGQANTRSSLETSVLALGLEGRISKTWKYRLSYSQSQDQSTQLATDSGYIQIPSIFDTEQTQLTWKNDIETPVGIVVVGLEQLKQNVTSDTVYEVDSRTINSVFAGVNGAAGAHSWQANVRSDHNSQFGRSSTGFVGYGFAFTPQWRANVSHGTSFVAPSFNDLYYPGYSNIELQPEKGRNTDVGLTYSQAGHTVKIVRFDNKIRGFITSTTSPSNVPQVRIDGWTLGYDGQTGPWTWQASLDSFDPRNQVSGKVLPRRNRNQVNLAVTYDIGAWKLGGQLLKAGERFDDTANTTTLAGYTTVDLNAEYKASSDWTVQGKINNLGNKKYQTVLGYNQPRRGVFLTLKFQPK